MNSDQLNALNRIGRILASRSCEFLAAVEIMRQSPKQLAKDDVYRTVLTIPKPRLFLVQPPPKVGCWLFNPPPDFIVKDAVALSLLVMCFAYQLRNFKVENVQVAVISDETHCGYGFEYEGADDVTITEVTQFDPRTLAEA